MSHKRRGVKEFIVFVIGAFFLTMGIIGFLFSCLPFNFFMAIVERYFINVVSFNQKTFLLFLIRLRVLSVIFCSLAAAVFIVKKNLISYSGALSGSLASVMRSWLVELKRFISIEDKLHLYSLLAITLSGAIVRFFYLFQPIRYDEAETYIACASKPIYFALSHYMYFHNHLLNTLLIFITTRLFGNEIWSIRLPAFFAGILIIPAVYLVARIFYDKNAAILAAALTASSVPLIIYSTNARGYMLLLLFFLLLVAISHQLKRVDSPALWLFFVIFAALGFYTIPTMFYCFGAVFTWLLLSVFMKNIEVEQKVFVKHLFSYSLAMFVVAILLYSPGIIVKGLNLGIAASVYVGPLSYPEFFSSILPRVRELSVQWSRGIPFLIQVFIIIGLSVSVVFRKRVKSEAVLLLGSALLYSVLAVLPHRRVGPVRIWMFMLPLFYSVAAGGFVYLINILVPKISRYSRYLFPTLAIICSLWISLRIISGERLLYDRSKDMPFDIRISTFLLDRLKAGDGIVQGSPTYFPLWYYFRKNGISDKAFLNYVSGDFNSRKCLYIIVNHPNKHTVEGLLKRREANQKLFTAPVLLAEYEFDSIYQLERIRR